MNRQMLTQFRRSERGIALVLTLLFLPVFIGVGLLVMDIGRGNNAQADHQAAADALALAGARELDGQPGARQDARLAMEKMSNSVSFLGLVGRDPVTLEYKSGASNPFTVIFLSEIPEDDDTAITQDWVDEYVSKTDADAKYVYVYSQATDLTTFFFNPVTRESDIVQIGASAVATLKIQTCDLAPLFTCNPFAASGSKTPKEVFIDKFDSGGLYGRLLKLDIHNGQGDLTPGNIGFLELGDEQGLDPVKAAMAGRSYDQCVELCGSVKPEPGGKEPAWDGFNTRFDLYKDNSGDYAPGGLYPPARNVRKGYVGSGCNPSSPEKALRPYDNAGLTEHFKVAPFVSNNEANDDLEFMGKGNWNLFSPVNVPVSDTQTLTFPSYWENAYSTPLTPADLKRISRHPEKEKYPTATFDDILAFPSQSGGSPLVSRYDVYRYEISLLEQGDLQPRAGVEGNAPSCYAPGSDASIDRRTMLVAIVDCTTYEDELKGSSGDPVPIELLAKMFLVRPHSDDRPNYSKETTTESGPGAEPGGGATKGKGKPGEPVPEEQAPVENGKSLKESMDVEVVDLVDAVGIGDTDEFLKAEALLVR